MIEYDWGADALRMGVEGCVRITDIPGCTKVVLLDGGCATFECKWHRYEDVRPQIRDIVPASCDEELEVFLRLRDLVRGPEWDWCEDFEVDGDRCNSHVPAVRGIVDAWRVCGL